MAAYMDAPFLANVVIASIIFFFLAAGVVLVLWIAMPFSLFGLKRSLKSVTEAQSETNRLLRSMLNILTERDERDRRLAGTRTTEPYKPPEETGSPDD
ncbi:MAG: hypothetical protein IME99_08080 [Proteobacteria bacterium]|nr:hypothetical protein [Pseudomonadota bacterium]